MCKTAPQNLELHHLNCLVLRLRYSSLRPQVTACSWFSSYCPGRRSQSAHEAGHRPAAGRAVCRDHRKLSCSGGCLRRHRAADQDKSRRAGQRMWCWAGSLGLPGAECGVGLLWVSDSGAHGASRAIALTSAKTVHSPGAADMSIPGRTEWIVTPCPPRGKFGGGLWCGSQSTALLRLGELGQAVIRTPLSEKQRSAQEKPGQPCSPQPGAGVHSSCDSLQAISQPLGWSGGPATEGEQPHYTKGEGLSWLTLPLGSQLETPWH